MSTVEWGGNEGEGGMGSERRGVAISTRYTPCCFDLVLPDTHTHCFLCKYPSLITLDLCATLGKLLRPLRLRWMPAMSATLFVAVNRCQPCEQRTHHAWLILDMCYTNWLYNYTGFVLAHYGSQDGHSCSTITTIAQCNRVRTRCRLHSWQLLSAKCAFGTINVIGSDREVFSLMVPLEC